MQSDKNHPPLEALKAAADAFYGRAEASQLKAAVDTAAAITQSMYKSDSRAAARMAISTWLFSEPPLTEADRSLLGDDYEYAWPQLLHLIGTKAHLAEGSDKGPPPPTQ